MTTWILLFRGINVGGKNVLKMKALVAILESLGLADVRTYIQSGNVACRAAEKPEADRIAGEIESRHGFRPRVLVLGADELDDAIASNPFPEAEAEPKTLHLSFLAERPSSPDLDALTALRTPTERFALIDRVFYLHASDGIGRSKLAANVERRLGVAATARNWRTVLKLRQMAEAAG